jgi:hypothetical protein
MNRAGNGGAVVSERGEHMVIKTWQDPLLGSSNACPTSKLRWKVMLR